MAANLGCHLISTSNDFSGCLSGGLENAKPFEKSNSSSRYVFNGLENARPLDTSAASHLPAPRFYIGAPFPTGPRNWNYKLEGCPGPCQVESEFDLSSGLWFSTYLDKHPESELTFPSCLPSNTPLGKYPESEFAFPSGLPSSKLFGKFPESELHGTSLDFMGFH